jgi:hypothetical protein
MQCSTKEMSLTENPQQWKKLYCDQIFLRCQIYSAAEQIKSTQASR